MAWRRLFLSGINPLRAAGNISKQRYLVLAENIKAVLNDALDCGGTTLRDFTHEDGKPGYFRIELKAYGRENQPCVICQEPMRAIKQGQRTTTYCTKCQK
ncbi:MAG: zinc finger domain-containing protein [Myxococcota bacterium]